MCRRKNREGRLPRLPQPPQGAREAVPKANSSPLAPPTPQQLPPPQPWTPGRPSTLLLCFCQGTNRRPHFVRRPQSHTSQGRLGSRWPIMTPALLSSQSLGQRSRKEGGWLRIEGSGEDSTYFEVNAEPRWRQRDRVRESVTHACCGSKPAGGGAGPESDSGSRAAGSHFLRLTCAAVPRLREFGADADALPGCHPDRRHAVHRQPTCPRSPS